MQEECRVIVMRQMPELVKLLLESNMESDTYTYCLEVALCRLENYSKPLSSAERISQNLTDFLDRYLCEQLPTMAHTIKTLSNVIIDDISISDCFKLGLLDFLLSVNFKAFRSARIHYEEYMDRRMKILDDLAVAQGNASSETRKEFSLDSFRQTMNTKLLSSCVSTSEEDALRESTASLNTVQSRAISEVTSTLARSSSGEVCPNPLQKQFIKPISSCTLARCNELGSKRLFVVAFGSYLRRKFSNATQCLQQYGEEGFVTREILGMFFLPGDCHYFNVVNHLIQLRPNVISNAETSQLVVDKFLKPLQYMQMIQLYINCCETPYDNGETIETLTSLTAALGRMIKPIVETLTEFERSLSNDKEGLGLLDFRRATKASFKSLELLWSLAAASYISYPAEFGNEPHSRSQHVLCSLVELTAQALTIKDQGRRAYSAALLLHVLQVHCRFLDNWWRLGEFNDCHEEFVAYKSEKNGRTEYVMRSFANGQPYMKICKIYKIIKRHIESAGPALAALYDSKRLADFVIEHKSLLEMNLHQTVVRSMHRQLKFYEMPSHKTAESGPDIFFQLKSTEDDQLRCLYYVYYKETTLELNQPEFCNIDELLQRCQSCVAYTPLVELICRTLERYLDQRVLLLNRYVAFLIRDRLQLGKVLEELRAVYLLFNFEQFAEQYSEAFGYLESGLIDKSALQLQAIMNEYSSTALHGSDAFTVSLPTESIEQLSLVYSGEGMFASIITEQQLKSYNEAFRMRLQLHVTVHRLQQLPQLNGDHAVAESLSQLQATVLKALEKQFRMQPLKKAAAQLDETLRRSEKQSQLQTAHLEFVQLMTSSLKLTVYRSQHELHELLTMARIVVCLWRRVEYIYFYNMTANQESDYEAQYALHNMAYLISVTAATKAMRCLHPLKDIVK